MRLFKALCHMLFAVVLSAFQSVTGAQGVNASGHWTGSIQAGDMSINFQLDLERDAAGKLAGTFSGGPSQVAGLPLHSAAVNGSVLRVVVRSGNGDSVFEGTIAADGKSMAGNVTHEGASYPFTLKHAGAPRIEKAPTNPAIAKSFEGTWNGTAQMGAEQGQFVVKLWNEAGGSKGTLAHVNRSAMELPVAIMQKGTSITIDVLAVGARFDGSLSADGKEIAGKLSVQTMSFPLTLKKTKD